MRSCNRRRRDTSTKKHNLRNKKGEVIDDYKYMLKCSRVMQVFKSSCLRSALRRDPESAQFLTRRDHRVMATGFSTRKRLGIESRLTSITTPERSVRRRLEEKCQSACEPCE